MNSTKDQLEKRLNWIAVKFWFWIIVTVATIATTARYLSIIASHINGYDYMLAEKVMRVTIGALGLGAMLVIAPVMAIVAYKQGERAEKDL